MLIIAVILIPLTNYLITVSCGFGIIFVLMRAYSAYLSKVKLNLNTFLYVFFVPELLTGPFRAFPQWKSIKINQKGSAKRINKILNGVIVILGSGILYSKAQESAEILIFKIIIIYVTLYIQFSSITKVVNEISSLFGQTQIINFSNPFLASSITDFWSRWHVSLGYFVRIYLSQPITFYLNKAGLSKKKSFFFSLMVSFIFVGLWHNISLEYTFFGIYFGLILFIERLYISDFINTVRKNKSGMYFCILYTQIVHILGFSIVHQYVGSVLVKI